MRASPHVHCRFTYEIPSPRDRLLCSALFAYTNLSEKPARPPWSQIGQEEGSCSALCVTFVSTGLIHSIVMPREKALDPGIGTFTLQT